MIAEKELIHILKSEILVDDTINIEADTNLLISGTIDSMALLRFVAAIEEKRGSKIPPTDLVIENFMNIKAIAAYLDKNGESLK